MLCRRPESIPEGRPMRAIEAALAGWCGRSLPAELQNNSKKQQRHGRAKISIKTWRNSGKREEGSRVMAKCASSVLPTKMERQVGVEGIHNKIIPKLHFNYVTSPAKTTPIMSLPTSAQLSSVHQQPLQVFTGLSSFQNRIQPLHFISNPNDNQPPQAVPVSPTDNEDAITVTVEPAKTKREQPIDSPLESLPSPNLVKVQTNSTNESHRRQLSQTNPKQQPSPQEGFQKQPRPKNFQRGTLFKAVRKSQTINTDAESDSSSSIVIEDYKSLMSKIHETKEVEEEQYDEI